MSKELSGILAEALQECRKFQVNLFARVMEEEMKVKKIGEIPKEVLQKMEEDEQYRKQKFRQKNLKRGIIKEVRFGKHRPFEKLLK